MFKIGLTAVSAILLTFASAKAVDNAASANAAAAFGEFGLAVSASRDGHPPHMDILHSARPYIRPSAHLCIRPFAGRNM
jgi:hypothetical protein